VEGDVPFAMISARSSLVPVRMSIRGALCELARRILEGGFRDDYQVCVGNAKVFEVREEQYCLEGLAESLDVRDYGPMEVERLASDILSSRPECVNKTRDRDRTKQKCATTYN